MVLELDSAFATCILVFHDTERIDVPVSVDTIISVVLIGCLAIVAVNIETLVAELALKVVSCRLDVWHWLDFNVLNRRACIYCKCCDEGE